MNMSQQSVVFLALLLSYYTFGKHVSAFNINENIIQEIGTRKIEMMFTSSATYLRKMYADPEAGADSPNHCRRALLQETVSVGLMGSFLATNTESAFAAEDIRGTPLTPFNGLAYNYRGGEYGGLDASTLNEPSVPYQEFLQRLKAGEVEFVEFMAPDGDAAYVTFKAKESEEKQPEPIRIGEGYPIEQHDGWSSPAFVVRSVRNQNVPYKFTVPALRKFRNS